MMCGVLQLQFIEWKRKHNSGKDWLSPFHVPDDAEVNPDHIKEKNIVCLLLPELKAQN